MTVRLDWLANINITISTTALQIPTFNNCMIMGVFPVASLPTSWGGSLAHGYSSLASIVSDFTPLHDAAITASNFVQAYKYAILLRAATLFFTQQPNPTILYLGCIDNTSTVNYVTAINNIIAVTNNFYAFYIADQMTATQLTQTNGVYDALTALATAKNFKIGLFDTDDLNITSGHFLYDATHVGGNIVGNMRAGLFANTFNPVHTTVTTNATVTNTLAAAFSSAYFTPLFTTRVGIKPASSQQLLGIVADSIITNDTLGTPGVGDGLLGVNANVYPSFTGGNNQIGLLQYGFMSSSTVSNILYLDQVVGADYLYLTTQAALSQYIINAQPSGGVPYNDAGIQALATVFKNALQNGVTQNIIQQFSNSDITIVPYSQVSSGDKAARIYNGLSASLTYLSTMQRVSVSINLSI